MSLLPDHTGHGASIELRNVSKTFGDYSAVVDFSLRVESGSFVTLLGPSGCGKTTTLMMLGGFVQPSSGRIILDGQDITYQPPNKRNIGMVFQSYALFPHMSVFDNVAFPLRVRHLGSQEIRARVSEVLSMVHMQEMADRRPSQLSGGQQQRVALARTIVFRPRILLMDEPLSALDRRLRDRMRFEIKGLQARLGVTVVYVTHDQGEALAMSDIVVIMRHGSIEQSDTPDAIYRKPATQFVADFVGEASFLSGRIAAADEGFYTVSLRNDFPILAKRQVANFGLKPGDDAIVVVRPECVRISSPSETTENAIPATVMDRTFLGDSVRYTLRLDSGDIVVAKNPSHLEDATVRQDTVTMVSISAQDVQVLAPRRGR